MHWFVISPINGLEVISDGPNGEAEAKELVEYELKYYKDHGLKPSDFYIFRGERHEYLPPSNKPRLVKMSQR